MVRQFSLRRARAFAGAALLLAGAGATAATAPDRAAPDCRLTLAGGGPAALAQYKGKVVYLDFWASWCAPCLASFPFMDRMQSELGARGLEVIAVNMDRRPDDAQRFLAQHPARFKIALGANDACARGFGVAGMPSTYLIDRKGRIRAVHAGFRPGEAKALRALVEQLLAEPAHAS
jgi:thiol-disulfide isomerase/thioredoxin